MQDETLHDEILGLLPWFVNNTLAEEEYGQVEGHLVDCVSCRMEFEQLNRLQDVMGAASEDGPDYRFSFQKLMNRIDESERTRVRPVDMRWPAFATAASLVLGVFLIPALWQSTSDGDVDPYRTLNIPQPEVIGTSQRMYLTFEQQIESAMMRSALIQTKSYIVSGPDEQGRYLVELKKPAEMSGEEFIVSLRAIDGVENAVYAHSTSTR